MSYKNIFKWSPAWVFRRGADNNHPRGDVGLIPLLFVLLLLLSACAGLPVRGSVGMQTIDTRVDSEVARYYLANYLAGKRSDAALDELRCASREAGQTRLSPVVVLGRQDDLNLGREDDLNYPS